MTTRNPLPGADQTQRTTGESTPLESSAPAGKVASSVELTDATALLAPSEIDWIARHALLALEQIGVAGQLRIRVVQDPEMTAAHAEFLDDPTTTDVLTFDMSDQDGLDVDIVACLDEAERRASEMAHHRQQELLLYVVHGVLHCAGFDDHEEPDRLRMHAREDEILEAIGAGATFHRPPRISRPEDAS